MISIENTGLIYDARERKPAESFCSFVGQTVLNNGTVLCSFQNGSGKHAIDATIRICRSRDHGQTWEELPFQFERTLDGVPGSFSSGEIVESRPGRLLLIATWFDRTDPDRPLFDPETEGILHSRQLAAESTDEGDTWSPWREFPLTDLRGCTSTGPLMSLSDGSVGYPFESFRQFDDPDPKHHAAWIVLSPDGGQTWNRPVQTASHPEDRIYYWDQRLCPGFKTDECVAMFWTHDLSKKIDLKVHLRTLQFTSEGLDRSPIQSTSIPGQIAAPLCLPDGRLLALVVNRGTPSTMTVWHSSDGGATWPEQDACVVYTHEVQRLPSQSGSEIDFKQYWEDMGKWTFGHPALKQLADGTILATFYAGDVNQLSVRWVRLRLRK